MELQCLAETVESRGPGEPRSPSVQHVFTVFHAELPVTKPTDSAQPMTETARDEDDLEEASDTFPLTNVPTETRNHSHDQQVLVRKDHSLEERIAREADEGMYVFAGDDQGFVTAWFVRRPSTHLDSGSTNQSLNAHASVLPTDSKTLDTGNTASATGTTFQHKEMVLGYDAIAGLYKRAFDQDRSQRPATSSSYKHPLKTGDVTPARSLQHKDPSTTTTNSIQVPPRARWKAHNGPILCLNHAIDPHVVLSSSVRGRIKVWSFRGELLGILDDFASRRKPVLERWRFPLDMGERRRRSELDAQQFLEKSKGLFRRGKQVCMSVMQERLSLTHEELTFDYTTEKRTRERHRHRHSRLAIRTSDVGRAIRKFILAQAAIPETSTKPAAVTSTSAPFSAAPRKREDENRDSHSLRTYVVRTKLSYVGMLEIGFTDPPSFNPVVISFRGRAKGDRPAPSPDLRSGLSWGSLYWWRKDQRRQGPRFASKVPTGNPRRRAPASAADVQRRPLRIATATISEIGASAGFQKTKVERWPEPASDAQEGDLHHVRVASQYQCGCGQGLRVLCAAGRALRGSPDAARPPRRGPGFGSRLQPGHRDQSSRD